MPHITIEYSANLEDAVDIEGLVAAIHETAVGIDALPIGGIRTRAARRDLFRVADCDPDNGFINVTLRIAEGRSLEVRQDAGERLFAALQAFVAPAYERRPMALSLEIQEIQPATRWKAGNIRAFMAKRKTGTGDVGTG